MEPKKCSLAHRPTCISGCWP